MFVNGENVKAKGYIRNPKGIEGHAWGPSEQDQEDFEQEKRIEEWLKSEGSAVEFGYQYRNSKGNARNSGVRAQVRLDQKIGEDRSRTYADIIAGCDGRDLEGRGELVDLEAEARETIFWYLSSIGLDERTIQWAIKTLKLSVLENKTHLEKFLIDSEW